MTSWVYLVVVINNEHLYFGEKYRRYACCNQQKQIINHLQGFN